MPVRKWTGEPEPHQPGTPLAALRDVVVRYNGSGRVLDGISMNLAAGERLAIVGPNGAGKTTLLKVMAGILAPSSGTVQIYGSVAGGHTCIGYVPQRSQVDWSFPVSVADVVMMGRIAKLGILHQAGRRDWDLVRGSLERVGMADLSRRQIGELSGGQQQRTFIARALAQEAELLLMDEPLTGLDIPSQEGIFAVLDQVRPLGIAVMISTHDLQLAAQRFDRLLLLNHRTIGLGTAAEVLTPANLLEAYGGHVTKIPALEGELVLEDGCCEGHDPIPEPPRG
jgi:manganese/iron transport system ATP-binding protein